MIRLPNVDPITGVELDILAMLEKQATERPNKDFLRTALGSITYAEFEHRASMLAGSFARLGIGDQTAVTILMENSIEQVIAWFALAKLGALHAPLNTALFGSHLQHTFNVTRCTFTIVDSTLLSHLESVQDPTGEFHSLIINETLPDTHGPRNTSDRIGHARTEVSADIHKELTEADSSPSRVSADAAPSILDAPRISLELLMSEDEPLSSCSADPLDDATLLFTSGTTGVSKACTLSRRYLAVQGAAHAESFQITDADVLYCPFPLFHIDAATHTVVAALAVGATAALGRRFSVSKFWHEVRHFEATIFNFMGATLTMLWKQPPSERDTDHSVRLAWGVPIPEWEDAWEARFGFSIYEVYGSTDAGMPVSDRGGEPRVKGFCGKVRDFFEVKIDGDEPIGEILVRGKVPGLTMSGYFGMPEATALTISAEGWVRTGDLGYLDSRGYLAFRGRASDSMRRRGENISAFEVEELLLSHPNVVEAAAIGVPSEFTEEDIKVCVVFRTGQDMTLEQLHDHMQRRAPRHMVPRYYEALPELPKTPTQKVEKYQLKDAGITRSTWDSEKSRSSS